VAVAAPDQQPVAWAEPGEDRGQVAGLLGFAPVGERLAAKALVDQGGRGVVEVGFVGPKPFWTSSCGVRHTPAGTCVQRMAQA
jgi:hypothetical protein